MSYRSAYCGCRSNNYYTFGLTGMKKMKVSVGPSFFVYNYGFF